MKILHTSDWHLGKQLEGKFRYDEQKHYINNIIDICNSEGVDLVIIAGDVYDTGNPPAEAEKIFYAGVSAISDGGKRPVVIVAGNHDNPFRLSAANPIAINDGIIILGLPQTVVEAGEYKYFSIYETGKFYFKMDLNGEKITFLTLPYPNEKRLNELFIDFSSEKDMQKTYNEKISAIMESLESKLEDDSINIAVAHLFVLGGQPSESERTLVSIGDSLLVNSSVFPKKLQYVALGHLHRCQKIKSDIEIHYSGSPMQFDKSEITHKKYVIVTELNSGTEANVKKIPLDILKQIEVWDAYSVNEAIDLCNNNKDRNIWVYINIFTNKVLEQSEIKEIRSIMPNVLHINPIINAVAAENYVNINEQTLEEQFINFYTKEKNVPPTKELVEMFLEMSQEE